MIKKRVEQLEKKVIDKDKEGNFIFENGEVFYSKKDENTSLIIHLIIRKII